MAKLIHIQASPRGGRSASQAVAARFVESYCAAHPGDTFDTLDLWKTDLPEINGATLDAAYAAKHGQPHSSFKTSEKTVLPDANNRSPFFLRHLWCALACVAVEW